MLCLVMTSCQGWHLNTAGKKKKGSKNSSCERNIENNGGTEQKNPLKSKIQGNFALYLISTYSTFTKVCTFVALEEITTVYLASLCNSCMPCKMCLTAAVSFCYAHASTALSNFYTFLMSYNLSDSPYAGSLQVSLPHAQKVKFCCLLCQDFSRLTTAQRQTFLFLFKIRTEIKVWFLSLLCVVAQQLVLCSQYYINYITYYILFSI